MATGQAWEVAEQAGGSHTHLERRGIEFVSLNESINTSVFGGVLIFHMMAALAEFERPARRPLRQKPDQPVASKASIGYLAGLCVDPIGLDGMPFAVT